MKMELSYAQKFALKAKNKWKNRLIKWLGGYDPVHVSFLVYRAGLLASSADLPHTVKTQDLARHQAESVRRAIMEVDPLYGIIRGYHLKTFRERTVGKVETSLVHRQTIVHPIVVEESSKTCSLGGLDSPA
jgi:hypothetical protein